MVKISVLGKDYYTNLMDAERIQMCIDFYSSGCTSYAISFGNHLSDVIQHSEIEGHHAMLLKGFNFNQCFLPKLVKEETDYIRLLEKGYDLIELL